ncbi:MAG: hypothetical protein OXI58_03880 [Gemmatimonadota bacterium]|nr:hypothetical protein [Gemmatimonadota bacterium]
MMLSLFRKVFNLLASDPVKSWNSHAFVACAVGLLFGVLAHFLNWPVTFWVILGWIAAYIFYRLREWLDEYKYRQLGTWRRRSKQGVTPKIDGCGDILGPRWIALAGIGLYILSSW